ncbi:MAG: hypothetical protein AAF170_09120 [Bacteroidota bacterium]
MTSSDPLLDLIVRYVRLTDADAEQILTAWGASRVIGSGDVLLAPGQRCRHVWFLDEGYGRFYTETEAADVTRHFISPGTYFTVVSSLYSGRPSQEGLQAITSGRLRVLSAEANDRLKAMCPTWDAFREAYIREVYTYLDDMLDTMRSQTAMERYRAFEQDSPDILLNVPLRYIASYLGMTPQSLSRIRAQHR